MSTPSLSNYPDLVAEWHPTRNNAVRPHEVKAGSSRKYWWQCPHGPDHEWRASANNRTQGTGCPFCAGRRPSVTNRLDALFPALAAEWHPSLNGPLTPARVVVGSTRVVWWRCAHAHDWAASVRDRVRFKTQCPYCTNRRWSKTNNLARIAPGIAREWHPALNPFPPEEVLPGSSRKAWWQCGRDPEHVWQATISNRVFRGSGCPLCPARR